MIVYSDTLFLTEKTKKNIDSIKNKLEKEDGMTLSGTYVIELASNGQDVFDMIPAVTFNLKSVKNRDHYVIGFAESKRACYKLVGEIVNEHYSSTGRYDGLREDIERRLKWF